MSSPNNIITCTNLSQFSFIKRLHLYNLEKLEKKSQYQNQINGNHHEDDIAIEQFGFHTTTCCGYVPLDNTWSDNWIVRIYLLI